MIKIELYLKKNMGAEPSQAMLIRIGHCIFHGTLSSRNVLFFDLLIKL